MNALSRWSTLGLLLALPMMALAQENNRERFDKSGTLRGVVPGGLQMATSDNELWNVRIEGRQAEVSYTASADASFLKPGMLVKFTAIVNKKGQVADPITFITVFTPVDRTELGVYPENTGGSNPLEGLFSSEKKEQPKKPVKKIVEDQPYRIGGTLASLKSGKMVVSAGGIQFKCELADDAKIRVALGNLSYAQVGDKVDAEGWYYETSKPNAVANRVSVTAVNTLTEEKKRPRPTAKNEKEPEEKKPEKKSD
jgi:hypothetical protein